MNILRNKNIKLAIFDMAGTTVQENGIIYNVLYYTLNSFNLDVNKKDIKSWHGLNKYDVLDKYLTTRAGYCSKCNNNNIEKLKINVYKTFESNLKQEYFYSDKISLMDEKIPEIFDKMRYNGIKIALNTGYPRDIQEEIINKLHMKDFINSYISSEDVQYSRPYPYMIFSSMEKHKIQSTQQVIKVGDTTNDILEGLNAGCYKSIGVLTGAENKEELVNAGANFVIDSVVNLID
tara:strand:+ start:47 stop:748 length:702 start_codon:yes stop_codon:yes gene_type:complete